MPPVLTLARWLRALACVFVLAAPSLAMAQANLDFEQEASEAAPPGWQLYGPAGQHAVVSSGAAAHEGRFGVEIVARVAEPSHVGGLIQSFDAAPYRGRRLTMSAAAMSLGGAGRLWIRINGPDGRLLFAEGMMDRPILSEDWARYAIDADVPADARSIVFGFAVEGLGAARVDDFRFTSTPFEPARALSLRGQANLVAFARLYGAVRYFHPSDEAAAANWEAFAHAGVARVESARNDRELERALLELFAPITTGLVIARSNASPPPRVAQDGDVAWRHVGFAYAAQENSYSRRRVRAPDDLGATTRVQLTRGLAAHVPVRLSGASEGDGVITGSYSRHYLGDDRTARLAAVIQTWAVLRHFYPYFADVTVDWEAQLGVSLRVASVDEDAAAFNVTLGEMTAPLKDGHIFVNRSGALPSGFPPLAWRWIENALVVTAVGEGVAGVRVGDVVREIDGVAVEALLPLLEARFSAGTPERLRLRAVERLAEGDLGQSRELTLDRSGQRLEARMVLVSYGVSRSLGLPTTPVIEELDPGVFYVDLRRISREAFGAATAQLALARGVIYDLRGYPSPGVGVLVLRRLSDSGIQTAQQLIRTAMSPDYVRVEDRAYTHEPMAPRFQGRVIFLTDARAMSQPETILAMVRHHQLGAIVGEPTAGANGNITYLYTLTGHSISFTGMEVRNHDGSRFHGVGVQPTHPISPTIDGVRAGRDEQLEAALALLREQGLD